MESRKIENIEADKEKLIRIENENQLEEMKKFGLLVELPKNEYLKIDSRLNANYHWCLPVVKDFLTKLLEDFHKSSQKSKHKIQINSAVRTVEYQNELRKRNKNAVEAEGPYATSHTTGATIDIAKLNLSTKELKWIKKYLLNLEKNGKIEATEEHYQAVFHIMVFKNYSK